MVVIRNKQELNNLLGKPKLHDFSFEFRSLNDLDTQKWLEDIKKDYFACGCDIGATFMIVSILIVGILILYFSLVGHQFLNLANIGYSLLFIFISSGIGKVLGLLIANHRLRNNIQHLSNLLRD